MPELVKAGWSVRAMARDARRLRDHAWVDDVQVVEADVSEPDTLQRALDGVDCAYDLVHSIGTSASRAWAVAAVCGGLCWLRSAGKSAVV